MLTDSGRIVAVASLVLLVVGWLLGYPELVALGVAGGVVLVVAAACMGAKPAILAERRLEPARVVEGDSARGIVTLTNEGSRRSLPVMVVEHVAGRRVAVPLPSLPPGGVHRSSYELPTGRRGIVPVGPLTIGVTDPFRLMHAGRDFTVRSTLLVHPRVHRVGTVPTGRSRDQDGATTSSAPRGGIAFHTLRPYERGDDPRQIHWRSSARTGELMVRDNVIPNEPRLVLVLDTSAEPYDDDSFEDAVRVVASLAVAACRADSPLTLRTTGGAFVGGHDGLQDEVEFLDFLAGVERSSKDPGLAVLTTMTPEDDGFSLGVVTGQPDDRERAAVGQVRRTFLMATLVQVGERFGRPAAPLRGVFTLNVATSEDFARAWNAKVRA